MVIYSQRIWAVSSATPMSSQYLQRSFCMILSLLACFHSIHCPEIIPIEILNLFPSHSIIRLDFLWSSCSHRLVDTLCLSILFHRELVSLGILSLIRVLCTDTGSLISIIMLFWLFPHILDSKSADSLPSILQCVWTYHSLTLFWTHSVFNISRQHMLSFKFTGTEHSAFMAAWLFE